LEKNTHDTKIFYVSYGQLRLFTIDILTDHSHDSAWRYSFDDAFSRITHHTMYNLRLLLVL